MQKILYKNKINFIRYIETIYYLIEIYIKIPPYQSNENYPAEISKGWPTRYKLLFVLGVLEPLKVWYMPFDKWRASSSVKRGKPKGVFLLLFLYAVFKLIAA